MANLLLDFFVIPSCRNISHPAGFSRVEGPEKVIRNKKNRPEKFRTVKMISKIGIIRFSATPEACFQEQIRFPLMRNHKE